MRRGCLFLIMLMGLTLSGCIQEETNQVELAELQRELAKSREEVIGYETKLQQSQNRYVEMELRYEQAYHESLYYKSLSKGVQPHFRRNPELRELIEQLKGQRLVADSMPDGGLQ